MSNEWLEKWREAGKKPNDGLVCLGRVDGVNEYVSRNKMTSGDHMLQRAHVRRTQDAEAQRGLHEYFKENPDVLERIINK